MNWISVKDGLPDYGTVSIVYCYDRNDEKPLYWQDMASYTYHGGWGVGSERFDRQEAVVTHWMPLPEPPQAQPEKKKLPTIDEMSGCIHDFTGGRTLKEYLDELDED